MAEKKKIVFDYASGVGLECVVRREADGFLLDPSVGEFVDGGENAVPVMTGYTTPSGVVSVDSVGEANEGWMAFDRNPTTAWQSASSLGQPSWIKYEFPDAKVIRRYSIRAGDPPVGAPINWVFQGSNDDVNWVDLDVRVDYVVWGAGERKEFTFLNDTAYKYYRVWITQSLWYDAVIIVEVELFKGYALRLVENAIVSGRYEVEESRRVWRDGVYSVIVYRVGDKDPIGSGEMYIRNDKEVTILDALSPTIPVAGLQTVWGFVWKLDGSLKAGDKVRAQIVSVPTELVGQAIVDNQILETVSNEEGYFELMLLKGVKVKVFVGEHYRKIFTVSADDTKDITTY